MFRVVQFIDYDEVEVIPGSWYEGNSCALWPPYKNSLKISKAVRTMEKPGKEWIAYPIKELYSTDDYQKARNKLQDAEYESDLKSDSEPNLKRKRRPNMRFESDSSDSENEPPQKTVTTDMTGAASRQTQAQLATTKRLPLVPPGNQAGQQSVIATPLSFLKERDSRIFTVLEEIKAANKGICDELHTIHNMLSKGTRYSSMNDADCPDGLVFPMCNMNDVETVETNLNNQDVTKALVDHLSAIGGGSLKIMTKRLMRYIMSNSLATQFNWTGVKGKKSLSALKLSSVIIRAVRRDFPQESHHQTEYIIKEWLRCAKDREGGRANRCNSTATNDSD